MARGSKSRNRSNERDTQFVANRPVARASARVVTSPLSLIQDLRSWDPEPATRPALTFSGQVATVGAYSPKKVTARSRKMLANAIGFHAPSQVLICVRRKRRKEVLHALFKTGRGSGRGRKRFNQFSKIRC